jgi:hypothetical protein
VTVRPVTLADEAAIRSWASARGLPRLGLLPPTGFIVDGVFAAYLVKTDTDVAFVEAYVTNPAASSADRSEAIDLVTQRLFEEARSCGFTTVLALTENQGLISRAVERHGFHNAGQKTGLFKVL